MHKEKVMVQQKSKVSRGENEDDVRIIEGKETREEGRGREREGEGGRGREREREGEGERERGKEEED